MDYLATTLAAGEFEASKLGRAKLHEARMYLMRNIRHELGVSNADSNTVDLWPPDEGSFATREVTDEDHEKWLSKLPPDAAQTAGTMTIELHAKLSLAITSGTESPMDTSVRDS